MPLDFAACGTMNKSMTCTSNERNLIMNYVLSSTNPCTGEVSETAPMDVKKAFELFGYTYEVVPEYDFEEVNKIKNDYRRFIAALDVMQKASVSGSLYDKAWFDSACAEV
jgi:hypothetical protein